MAFRPYESSKNIVEFYRRYLLTTFKTNDAAYNQQLEQQLNNDAIYRGPFVCLTNPYKHTVTLAELISDGTICADINNIVLFGPNDKLFKHQEDAIRKYRAGKNLIVTTGTGSGKTKTFMLPVIDQLLREKASNGGVLSSGVRILIIYPMNALVNDQMEEWKNVLSKEKGITFAHLTSETPKTKENGDPDSTNYIRYRDEIYNNPPHILITNYAMLERVLLTPESGKLFTNPNGGLWQTIILDEAHSYKGTLGIEISALLRRLRARVNREHFRFILTSATLGDNDIDIAHFGEILCSESFTNDSIVRSVSVTPDQFPASNMKTIALPTYSKMADAIRNENDNILCSELGIQVTNDVDAISKALYDYMVNDTWISKIRDVFFNNGANGIISLSDAASQVGITEDALTDIITVATNAGDGDKRLFEAKYHLFIKGIDGVFITLPPTKKLFLEKMDTWENPADGEKYKVFQVSFCHKCGALFICGQLTDDSKYFVQSPISDENENNSGKKRKKEFYETTSVYRIDESDIEDSEGALTICSKCGAVKDAVHNLGCGHSKSFEYTLICVKKEASNLHVCPCCGNRDSMNSITRPFMAGSDASSSVVGTALYNELPTISRTEHVHEEINHPVFGKQVNDYDRTVEQKKQFLVFSDNRQKAAKFVDQFGGSYRDYLLKRLAFIVAHEHSNELASGIMFDQFVTYFTDKLIACKVYDEDINELRNKPQYREYYLSKATLFLINEICGYRSKNSLMKKGGLYFSVKLDYPVSVQARTRDIFQMMLCQFMRYGALYADDKLTDDDYEQFINQDNHNGNQRYGFDINSDYWKPNSIRGFKKYLVGILGSENDANQWLDAMWSEWSNSTNLNYLLIPQRGTRLQNNKKVLATGRIVIKSTSSLYQCSKCKNITPYFIDGKCEKPGCDGQLIQYDPDVELVDDHYYWLYRNISPYALDIREHTAQLSTEKAKDYQQRFSDSNKGINALSCTTTFEMGVNVGSLQTVFMRNIPPSPANYVQRSGRAGRSKEAASFTVTFCPNSPHDRYYYRYPDRMIGGTITPPNFNIQNKEVLYRHIFAATLSFFWENNPAMYPEVPQGQRDYNASNHRIGDFIKINGFDELKQYIDSHQSNLTKYLKMAFPGNIIDQHTVDNYDWVDYFYEPTDGLISRAVLSYKSEHTELEQKRTYFDTCYQAATTQSDKSKFNAQSNAITKTLATLENQDIIGFLSRNTILPKYGFPTDIVTLKGTDSDVELDRGLALAISEYAPDSLLFADGKTYISRYVETPSGYQLPRYFYRECSYCSSLNRRTNAVDVPELCDQCHKKLSGDVKSYVIPKFGFRIEKTEKNKKKNYTEKSYRSAISYLGNSKPQQRYSYSLNGKCIKASRSKDDTLAILNTKEFKICKCCGYATSGDFPQSTHTSRFGTGGDCKCKDYDVRTLGYELITDVAILDFVDCPVPSIEAAWTILYALLEGLSKTLNIERNDISGCLKKFGNRFGFVLFDTAPGGAGYVKNLVEDSNIVVSTFREAFRVVNSCTCGGSAADVACYSCLCNYGNQVHHHILKRIYAIDFFKQFANDPDDAWIIVNQRISAALPAKAPSTPAVIFDSYDDANDVNDAANILDGYADESEDKDTLDVIRRSSNLFVGLESPKVLGNGSWNNDNLTCSLLWPKSQTVLFFIAEQTSYNALQTNPDWNCFIADSNFNVNDLISKIGRE